MRNHPLYKKLQQIALDGDCTIEKIQSLNFNQAATILEERPASSTFFNNMKNCIIMELQDREDGASLRKVKSKIKTWLDTNFPGWAVERGRENSKPYIKLWLKGKPANFRSG